MSGSSAETVEPGASTDDETVVVSIPLEDTKSARVITSGSYTMGKNILVVAIEMLNDTPTCQELQDLNLNFDAMTRIKTSEMATFLSNHDIVPPSENEPDVLSNEASQVIEKDDEYYLSMVKFNCKSVEFLVPHWGFAKSMPKIVLYPRANKIHSVSPLDFRCLMEIMYPLDPMNIDHSSLPCQHSVSVLKLASKWRMIEHRNQAFNRLQNGSYTLSPEDKYVLGRLCGIVRWCEEACTEFVKGKPDLRNEHEAIIGIDAMLKITRARDDAYRDDVLAYHRKFPGPASFTEGIPRILQVIGCDAPDSRPASSNLVAEFCAARENRLLGCLEACYERLIDREESITSEEVSSLGLDTAIEIWKARRKLFEQYRKVIRRNTSLNPTPYVKIVFREELKEAELLQGKFGPLPVTRLAREPLRRFSLS